MRYLFFFIFLSVNVNAQNVYIPDDNFESELILLGLDSVLDDSVSISSIDTVSQINIDFKSIYSLEGIENFSNLKEISFIGNFLNYVDFSSYL